jgi:hypothetical protein
MRLTELANGRTDVVKLRPEVIGIKPNHNYRDMGTPAVRAHIDWLKSSIREVGVRDPICVSFDPQTGKVYLEAGECRLTAAQELRKEDWDGWILARQIKGDEAALLADSLVENGGLPPTKLDFGKAAERLLAYGWTAKQIASYAPPHVQANFAKAVRYVNEAVELQQAPLEVKQLVKNGVDGVKISEAKALASVRKSPLTAAETLRREAGEAKAKGKAVLKREKGAGTATRAKEADRVTTGRIFELADYLADLALDPETAEYALRKAARTYNAARGR